MKSFLVISIVLAFFVTPVAAQLYDCNGNAACEAKRATVKKSTYNSRIGGCLAAQGYTREQWRARSVPAPAAAEVRACVSR